MTLDSLKSVFNVFRRKPSLGVPVLIVDRVRYFEGSIFANVVGKCFSLQQFAQLVRLM